MANRRTGDRGSGNAGQIPQRVENAARMMNEASSGPRRGYVPGMDATGRQQVPPGGWQQTGNQPVQGQGWNQNTQPVYYGGQSAMTGGQRGFVMTNPPQAQKKKKKRSPVFAVIAVVLILAALGAGGYYALEHYQHTKTVTQKIEPYNDLFCPGVYVDGIHLGGMTPEQAMNSVQSQIRQRHDAWKVELVYAGSVVAEINADMMEFNVDPAHVLNEAWLQGHTGDSEQRYEDMLRLEQNPWQAYTAQPDGNTQAIDNQLEQIKNAIDTAPTDAAMVGFDPSQPYPFLFTDEAYGFRLDTETIKERLYKMVSTMESGTVELVPERLEPSVRKSDLMKHYMLRSSVYTPIDKHSTEERNNNIRKALGIINGYVLNAGKTFSFNGVVGQRSEANGWYPAIEYVYGEHVEGFGGGVCQASTTLYQAAVCAGLQIIKREPHSDSVSYTDYGKDATVYWVGKRKIDLSFKNTTDEPIYIVASVQEDPSNKKRLIAKVSMYGQDMGDVRYELESEITETLPAPFEPVYVKDTGAMYVVYKDQQESVSKAKEGYVVKSYRVQYTGNVLSDRKELFTDTYQPKAERIYVGVKDR